MVQKKSSAARETKPKKRPAKTAAHAAHAPHPAPHAEKPAAKGKAAKAPKAAAKAESKLAKGEKGPPPATGGAHRAQQTIEQAGKATPAKGSKAVKAVSVNDEETPAGTRFRPRSRAPRPPNARKCATCSPWAATRASSPTTK
ncbi:MAG: hypothetical protein E6J62_16560 [Deltaproteobacteria bacterium]|nr:MAG: hypothetical protein E6J62_16560 [Deltaproteobacteria bacterium]